MKNFHYYTRLTVIISMLLLSACQKSTEKDYPIQGVNFADIKLTDEFWTYMINRNKEVTLPYILDKLDPANHPGGSGLSKVLEGISYYIMMGNNKELENLADTLISYIKATQQEDGDLGRRRSNPDGTPLSDSLRWMGIDDFGEVGGSPYLYGSGHMYEAAAAHYLATGKTSFLDIAEKNAQLILSVFGPDKLQCYPSHPEIELALIKLYRATGKKEYLELSKFFLDARGPNGTEYSQSHKKIIDQKEAIGHAVRALYLYSGISDIVALTGDKDYELANNAIWKSVVDSKLYITGGLGAYADHEAFGEPYYLPNVTSYNETCASIANVFWNYRMFLLYGQAEYIDILERTLYNSLLDGVSISGDRFFYPNALESHGQYQRASWYGVPCCLSNIIRFMPQVPGYIYAKKDNNIYVNLFMSNTCKINIPAGTVGIVQETAYPWEGKVKLTINPEANEEFNLMVRIPGWAKNKPVPSDLYHFSNESTQDVSLTVNGSPCKYTIKNGYALINHKWLAGDVIELELPMDVRKVMANKKVENLRGRMAVERGPIVYCLEGPDNKDISIHNLMIDKDAKFELKENHELPYNCYELTTTGSDYKETGNSEKITITEHKVTAIPYYLWANRGPSDMLVWIPSTDSVVSAEPYHAPSIASTSKIISSYDTTTLSSINDRFIIPYHQNIPISNYYRWPMDDKNQWVQYKFKNPETVSSVQVYWYDNEPSTMTTWYNDIPWTCCRVPESWQLFYLTQNGTWKAVKALNEYGTEKYKFNKLRFEPVNTTSLKMTVKRHSTCASGIIEWIVN